MVSLQRVETSSEIEAICGRYVRWPGSLGWYYVVRYEGISEANGRRMWLCMTPSLRMLVAMIPARVEVNTCDLGVPRLVELWLESEKE